ncbi:MAG: outer membrane protein assembly factor [Gemmatimonadota bacterium]
MRASPRCVAPAGICLFGLLTAGPALGQETRDRQVTSLTFVGNVSFPDRELAAVIETRTTRCRSFLLEPFCLLTNWGFAHERGYLDERDLPVDMLRLSVFYRQRGYLNAKVDTAVTRFDDRARIQFLIEEGLPTPVDSLRIVGIRGILDPARIRREIGLKAGDPFDRVKLEAGKELIRDRLQDRGYVNAAVLEETFTPTGKGARIVLTASPGVRARIGEVRITGAGKVGDKVVRQFLTFRRGQFYSRERILESQRNLFNLEAVRFASISRTTVPGDSLVDLDVRLTEAATRTLRAGGGASTTQCVLTEARVTHRNFFGNARRLQLTARLSNLLAKRIGERFPCTDVGRDRVFRQLNFRLQAEFQQPYFFSSRNSFRGVLFLERQTVPEIFVRTSKGAELSITRRFKSRMPVTFAFRPEFTSFDRRSADIFFCVNFGFCQPKDIRILTGRRRLNPISVSWRYDATNAPFSPTRGFYTNFQAEWADAFMRSDFRYVRFVVEAADFRELSPGLVLAGRIRSGVVESIRDVGFDLGPGREDVIHPQKRFFGGGPQSLRGFGQNLLGPTVLVVDSARNCPQAPVDDCVKDLARRHPGRFQERPVGGNAGFEASAEVRKKLSGGWGLVGFIDFGQVWESLSDLRAPVVTPGLGFRFASPVGPLRLDIGYNPTSPRRLPVVVELPNGEIRELAQLVDFDPFGFDDPNPFGEFLRRLQFHVSVGEAF